MVLLSFAINYPHFAHSYQIFYRQFGRKAFGHDYSPMLRARYLFAGVIVPAALALFFTISVMRGDDRMLAYGANLMFLLVGWHYVKQGYGILMVDAVLKRQFFTDAEKRVLRLNGYMVWFLMWLLGNVAVRKLELLDLHYYTFDAPVFALNVVAAIALATGCLSVWTLLRRWQANGGSLPYNGVFAYVASLYFWILLFGFNIAPIWLLSYS